MSPVGRWHGDLRADLKERSQTRAPVIASSRPGVWRMARFRSPVIADGHHGSGQRRSGGRMSHDGRAAGEATASTMSVTRGGRCRLRKQKENWPGI